MVVGDSGVAKRTFIAGGAGFIGSHMARRLLDGSQQEVVVFDNLSSGTREYLADVLDHERLTFIVGDLQDLEATSAAIDGCDRMFLFAANPDIAKAVTEPAIDFWQGTYLTNNAIEAARIAGVRKIVYSSGSGVYGDRGEEAVREDAGAMHPVSTYGASKLAGEALISAYAYMFDSQGFAFRFGNVVGRRQTHGVGFDFLRRLREDPMRLTVLGDGTQSKSYVPVTDVVRAVLGAVDAGLPEPFNALNVATGDYITVREIAELSLEVLDLDPQSVDVRYGTSNRGWKGDVPIVRLSTEKIRSLGWQPSCGSREALRRAEVAMLEDLEAGLGV